MKKLFYVAIALLAAGCSQETPSDAALNDGETLVHFRVTGDFDRPTFTRGDLSADNSNMTDLWVFDFVDEECVQTLHLTPEDEDWGEPAITMAHGEHTVCFVVSRGDEPVVDEDAQTITWSVPRDAFWGDLDLEVTQTTAPVTVTLDRVATKLRLVATDAVPTNAKTVAATPAMWYYGLNYWTGEPDDEQTKERTVTIPASYAGTEGQLVVSFFGISGTSEWFTDVVLRSKDADGNVIGIATITAAPFKANRATEYSGRLFTKEGSMDITLNAEWLDTYTGTW